MPSDPDGGCCRFISLALFAAVCCTPPFALADDAPLIWAADAEGGAPYVFINPRNQDENIGFEVDLIEALSKELGREIKFKQYPYESLALGLQKKDFDFVLNGIEVTPDRERLLRLSRPYYLRRLQLVGRKGETRFRDLESCKAAGLTVGTLNETGSSRLLDEQGIKSRFYDGQAEPYQDLQSGRTDAVLLDLPVALYYAKNNPKLEFIGEPFSLGAYAAMFRKDQEELAKQFDEAIKKLAANGELQRIYEKWQLWNDDQSPLSGDEAPTLDVLKDSAELFTFASYFPKLRDAAVMTIKISVVSMSLAMAIGLVVAIARLYGPLPVQWLAITYVEFFRGIPVLLLLYVIYYGLPIAIDPFTAAVIAFGLNYGAYEAEIYRSGISAVPQGQWEAAVSLGMPWTTTFRRIIFPQALRTIIPPVTNDFVALFKDTSLVSSIALVELTKEYQILSKSSLKYLEIGLVTAIIYLAMSVPLGMLARRLEKIWGKGQ